MKGPFVRPPGPSRKRAARSEEGRRAHREAYSKVIEASMTLECSSPDADRVQMLKNLEDAAFQSTGYSNSPLMGIAERLLHEARRIVLDNSDSARLSKARQMYWSAARRGLER